MIHILRRAPGLWALWCGDKLWWVPGTRQGSTTLQCALKLCCSGGISTEVSKGQLGLLNSKHALRVWRRWQLVH
jgi:hypothetical protein